LNKLFILLIVVLLVPTAVAQETDPGVTLDDVNAIAGKLYCPVCPNETLDSCRTAACAQWREEIRVQLVAGRTEDQIIADFVTRYGERVVDTPLNATLRGLALYTPYALLALVAGVALFTLLRWGRKPSPPAPLPHGEGKQPAQTVQETPSPPLRQHRVGEGLGVRANDDSDDDYRARLERDLRQ
jgi:cytochrome c-type biogenesis protein CcmH